MLCSVDSVSKGEDVKGISVQTGFIRLLLADPRNYQISVLSTLILLGLFHYGFHLPWWHVAGCIGATLTTQAVAITKTCLLYTSPSPRDLSTSRMPSSA